MFTLQWRQYFCLILVVIGLTHGKEYYRPDYGRAVYPLIPLEKVSFKDEERLPPPPIVEREPPTVLQKEDEEFVETSNSNAVFCQSHADCYGYREPDDWCPPPSGSVWRDRGCYCDRTRSNCIIDRTINGNRQWSYCISKGASQC